MSNRTITMDDRLYAYLLAHSSREPDLFRRLRDETAKLPDGRMQISPEQGQFMALMIELIGANRAIEIGTFTGYSALWTASALPPEGRLVACDVSEEWTSIGRRYWREAGLESKIDLRLGTALETLKKLELSELGKFDFAFIDADKSNYAAYYESSLRLLRPGGLIAIDNTLWGGRVADFTKTDADTVAIRAITSTIHHDARVTASLVPIGDGLLLARKRP